MASRLKYSEVDEFIKNNGCTLLSKSYKNAVTPIKIKCECGNIFETPFYTFKTSNIKRCGDCWKGRNGQRKKRDHDDFVKEVNEMNKEYVIMNEYKGRKKKVKVKHSKCGFVFETVAQNLLRETKCVHCDSIAYREPDLLKEWNKHKNTLNPNTEGFRSVKKAWWTCKKCKTIYKMKISSKQSGASCPYCRGLKTNANNNLRKTHPEILKDWDFNKNTINPEELNFKKNTEVWWICPRYNHSYKTEVQYRAKGQGCPYCAGRKVLVGFNDMWTTNPALASLLLSPEVGYKRTQSSNRKADWKCKCGNILRNKIIGNIRKRGLSCPLCGDYLSLPERYVYAALKSAKANFLHQQSFSWSQGKIYDFFLPNNNLIIEVHGEQHYDEKPLFGGLNVNKENDLLKKRLAIENGYRIIVIEAKKSEIDYLEMSVKGSELDNLFLIDYNRTLKIVLSGTVSNEICNLWNKGYNVSKISLILGLGEARIRNILKSCTKIGLCNYTPKEYKKRRRTRGKSIIQLSRSGQFIGEWRSAHAASTTLGFSNSSIIGKVCKGEREEAYGFKWVYKKDYKSM